MGGSICLLMWEVINIYYEKGSFTMQEQQEVWYMCVCVCARVCVCVCGTRGWILAVLGPFWLFLLLSTASVCTLIKTLNLFLTHTLAHTPSHSQPPLRLAPNIQFTLYSRIFIYSHIHTSSPTLRHTVQQLWLAIC